MLAINIFLIIIFYLIGSLPFALILTKLFGFGDIRNIGSGNVGATNVLRTGNKLLAFFVLCLDIMKVLWIGFNDSKYKPCPLLKKMVSSGLLGKKSGKVFYNYD